MKILSGMRKFIKMKKLLKQSKYFEKRPYLLLSIFLFVVLSLSCQVNVSSDNDSSELTFSINTVSEGNITSIILTASTSVKKVVSYSGSKIIVKRTHASVEQEHVVQDATVNPTQSTAITITFLTSFTATKGNTIIVTIPAGYFEDNFGNKNTLTTLTTVIL